MATDEQLGDIRGMLQQIQGRMERMEDRMERIEGHLQQVETRAMASDSNAIARGLNGGVAHPGQSLHPLRGLATNEEIPGFPLVLQDIEGMSEHTLGAVLCALDQPSGGAVAEKRKRLKSAIGIMFEAV